jgi:hypothetical protein
MRFAAPTRREFLRRRKRGSAHESMSNRLPCRRDRSARARPPGGMLHVAGRFAIQYGGSAPGLHARCAQAVQQLPLQPGTDRLLLETQRAQPQPRLPRRPIRRAALAGGSEETHEHPQDRRGGRQHPQGFDHRMRLGGEAGVGFTGLGPLSVTRFGCPESPLCGRMAPWISRIF